MLVHTYLVWFFSETFSMWYIQFNVKKSAQITDIDAFTVSCAHLLCKILDIENLVV